MERTVYSFNSFILQGDRLQNIIESFRDITGLPNIAGAIDGTHIPLSTRSNRRYTPMPSDFFNRNFFYSIVLQGVCDTKGCFGMFLRDNLVVFMMLDSLLSLPWLHN